MQTKILPLVAGVAFMIVAAFAVVHFDVLTGASSTLSATLPLTIVVAGVLGALRSLWLRRRDPSRFANLGRNRAQ
ncbi:hypothetical protein B5V03_01875 [Bradyrhizobium betae]|uniref:Uncharacterized protein n=1 Tax=Bradyrhizobium betae TaxID=244734 RepID=A0A4V1P8D3_9BRAD|nr:hypothetical protein B5V03_01875 [Bradyrhizobium betae]